MPDQVFRILMNGKTGVFQNRGVARRLAFPKPGFALAQNDLPQVRQMSLHAGIVGAYFREVPFDGRVEFVKVLPATGLGHILRGVANGAYGGNEFVIGHSGLGPFRVILTHGLLDAPAYGQT